MRTPDLYVAGLGAHLPARVETADAVSRGWYSAEQAEAGGITSVCVADEHVAAEMAVLAAKEALGGSPPPVRAVLHTYLDSQGARYWSAAPYVAAHAVGADVPGYDVLQSCNGGLAAVELGARLLADGGGHVLVTAADRFDAAGFDRWNCDSQAVFGDGAGALLLGAHGGFARITAIATGYDNGLEAESRGDGFPAGAEPVDFTAMRERYHHVVPVHEHLERIRDVITETFEQVLDEAGTTADRITRAVPVVATEPVNLGLFRILGLDDTLSTWDFGATTGHLGAADNLVGLHHLVTTGAVRPGDAVLLVGGGSGFACTLAVVEVTGQAP
ncbi:ketoacyl-ACP synthase III family protein [Saccharothrix syringae]|uniref:Secondary metabolite biosynthesis protein n=1 Tax=Saccharothrix syringae TaxID=103733 RepID=A0A5Q0H3Q7_SACSY|nr:ketoacyl-ACP synthase III family protein [Saccharothrix syringae]QFZ20851.1 secondary metabolite biosynthesis protein [Saccharothrix syringae]